MIKIDKGQKPSIFDSDDFQLAIEKLEAFYNLGNRAQDRYDFPFNSKLDRVLKPIFHEIFHGKCGYCEVKIDSEDLGVIDRFRPYSGVRDLNEYFEDLYWWLVFDWDNLIYSCKECNQYKANYFPVIGPRLKSKTDNIFREKKLLLNPCIDELQSHLISDSYGALIGITEEGAQTIELLRLNRKSLLTQRGEKTKIINQLVTKLTNNSSSTVDDKEVEFLRDIFNNNPDIEFIGSQSSYLLKQCEINPLLPQIIGVTYNSDYPIPSPYKNFEDGELQKIVNEVEKKIQIKDDFFPIDFVQIKNFKGISDLTITFTESYENREKWLFLLGENGLGKSSILQAIALGFHPIYKSGDPKVSELIQKRKHRAEIIIKEKNSNNLLTTVLTRKDNLITHSGAFDSFLIGYGSLRLSTEETIEKSKNDFNKVSYVNLFEPVLPLNNVTKWIKNTYKTDSKKFDSIAYSIKKLMPSDSDGELLEVKANELYFKDSDVPFGGFSDGYKSTITLALDIMMKLSSANADMDKLRGIVLIDELGNQLHPRWQMRIVTQLRSIFPKINFIISTHHPLCLRGSESGEVVLLRRIKNEIIAIKDLPNPSELRVDQLLSSEYFGLSSLIDPSLEDKFNRYYELLNKEPELGTLEHQELDALKDELREKKHLGNSLREELMYSVIDKLLAQKVNFSDKILNRNDLKEETITRVKEIWERLNINPND